MRITILTFLIVLLTLGCSSTPAPTPVETSATAVVETEVFYVPTTDWLARHSTERAATVFALETSSATLLPTRPPTQTATPRPTATLHPNSPLISLKRYPNDGVDEILACVYGLGTYRFVLYQDGRIILFDNGHYLTTTITQSEIDKLLKQIEGTGIFEIQGDGDQYVVGAPTPSYSGGWGTSIAVKGNHITIEDSQEDYLVNPVLETLNTLTNFRPEDLKAYKPDSVIIWSFSTQDTVFGSNYPTPTPPMLNWSNENISLDQFTNGVPHEVSDNTVSFLLDEIGYIPAFRIVQQGNEQYFVLVCPAFD